MDRGPGLCASLAADVRAAFGMSRAEPVSLVHVRELLHCHAAHDRELGLADTRDPGRLAARVNAAVMADWAGRFNFGGRAADAALGAVQRGHASWTQLAPIVEPSPATHGRAMCWKAGAAVSEAPFGSKLVQPL